MNLFPSLTETMPDFNDGNLKFRICLKLFIVSVVKQPYIPLGEVKLKWKNAYS